jgi:hypothetical protein
MKKSIIILCNFNKKTSIIKNKNPMKRIIIILETAALLLYSTVAYCNKPLKQEEMNKPYYVIDFRAVSCSIDVMVNDVSVFSMDIKGHISMKIPVNKAILESGEQQVSYHILPLPGNTALSDEASFSASVWLYEDWNEPKEEIHTFTMPENKTGTPLPMYVGENSFIADMPYSLNGWQNSQDLTKIENLRELAVAAFRKIENIITNGQYDELITMLQQHENNTATCLYLTEEEKNQRISGLIDDIKTDSYVVVPVSEEDMMVVFGHGKLVTLKKPDGSSALLLKNQEGEELSLEIRLHLEQGKTELTII